MCQNPKILRPGSGRQPLSDRKAVVAGNQLTQRLVGVHRALGWFPWRRRQYPGTGRNENSRKHIELAPRCSYPITHRHLTLQVPSEPEKARDTHARGLDTLLSDYDSFVGLPGLFLVSGGITLQAGLGCLRPEPGSRSIWKLPLGRLTRIALKCDTRGRSAPRGNAERLRRRETRAPAPKRDTKQHKRA